MSDTPPEPSDVGPIAGGNLRASDADREKVANVLNAAYAEGRLSREEHDQRLSELMAARTFDDLVPITRDLVVARPGAAAQQPAPSTTYEVDTRSASEQPGRFIAVFGGTDRRGKWRVRKNNQALALFGGIDLDMRDAIFESPTIEITAISCFGGLDIKVPDGVDVRNEVVGIFGGSDTKDINPMPGSPTLVVKGLALFGGVSVKGPKSGRNRS
jgi:uncharacterized protein DUF1707